MEVKRVERMQRFKIQQKRTACANSKVRVFHTFVWLQLRKLVEHFFFALDLSQKSKSINESVIDILIGVLLHCFDIITIPPHNKARAAKSQQR